MNGARLFFRLLGWDIRREARRRETLPNMVLFALLVLFLARIGVAPDPRESATIGPVMLWIAVIFAGTVGLGQAFAAEREGDAIAGVITAPLDLGVYYLAKVAACSLYVLVMEVLVLVAYSILFDFPLWKHPGAIVAAMAVFTVGYMAPGVLLAAMTSSLRGGGEVLLRLLLLPLMLPYVRLLLGVSGRLFDAEIAGGALGSPLALGHFLAAGAALDTMYLALGYLLFPKVLEE